jgi:hypothetical protein
MLKARVRKSWSSLLLLLLLIGKESSSKLAGANFKHTNSAPIDPKPTKSIRKRTSAARLLSFTGWALCTCAVYQGSLISYRTANPQGKTALVLIGALVERRHECLDEVPILATHDEIVALDEEDQAEQINHHMWLRRETRATRLRSSSHRLQPITKRRRRLSTFLRA